MSEEAKAPYMKAAEEDRERYRKEVEEFDKPEAKAEIITSLGPSSIVSSSASIWMVTNVALAGIVVYAPTHGHDPTQVSPLKTPIQSTLSWRGCSSKSDSIIK